MKYFKKITSLILAVVFVFVMNTVAFAAPGSGTPIGDEYTQQSYVAKEIAFELLKEERMWDYDSSYLYIDNEGTMWRWYANKNWKMLNDDWLYKTVDDRVYVIDYRDYSSKENDAINLVIPEAINGIPVTDITNAGNDYTMSITVPEGIVRIGYHAFNGLNNLQRVIIPASVKSIEVGAFKLCSDNGVEIYYEGTEEQWNDIVVWNPSNTIDPIDWAVTDFNWTAEYAFGDPGLPTGTFSTDVKAVHFNVDPDTLEDLVPEEENPQQSIFDQIFAPVKQFFAKVVEFFKTIVSWFTFGQ